MGLLHQRRAAAFINRAAFRANDPNRMLAIAYRPAWPGPIAEVAEWPAERVAGLPEPVRALFGSLNTREFTF
ncbi:MAG: hypothetical protein KGS47_15355, partial [Chloroflexi bacterium]|nr:hypothetical protein [Chloroflexota bacterium]